MSVISQQDGLCGIDSIVAEICHPCDSLMCFVGQWRSVVQMDYLHQVCQDDQYIFVVGLYVGFADSKKDNEYQDIPFNSFYCYTFFE